MEHIGGAQILQLGQGHFAKNQTDMLRERLPELIQVPEDQIEAHGIALWDAVKCRRKCHGCNDFTTCWQDGDGKGRVVKVSVADGQLSVEKRICKPRLAYEARERHEKMLAAAGITEGELGFTFENFPEEQRIRHMQIFNRAHEFAHGYAGGPTKGLNLFGTPGIGKTHLLRAIVNRLNDRGIPAVFVRTKRIMDKLKSAIREGGDVDGVLEMYKTAPVLALDELGQEKMTDYSLDSILDIIDYRAEHMLTTFFATNFRLDELYQRYYSSDTAKQIEALRSRVAYLAIPALMEGDDYRANFDEMLGPEVGE